MESKEQRANVSIRQSSPDEKILSLEDSTLEHMPYHASQLIKQSIDAGNKHKCDILMALLVAIAVESGFVPNHIDISGTARFGFRNNKKLLENNFFILPNTFWSQHADMDKNNYKLELKLIGIDERLMTTASETSIKLYAFQLGGDGLSITVNRKMNEPGRSLYLIVSKYIPLSNRTFSAKCFRHLTELSHVTKNTLFTPIHNQLLYECDSMYPGLLGIPQEIRLMIYKKLGLNTLKALKLTCKLLADEITL